MKVKVKVKVFESERFAQVYYGGKVKLLPSGSLWLSPRPQRRLVRNVLLRHFLKSLTFLRTKELLGHRWKVLSTALLASEWLPKDLSDLPQLCVLLFENHSENNTLAPHDHPLARGPIDALDHPNFLFGCSSGVNNLTEQSLP